ncbi:MULTISPECIES: ElyC/SanA/YdcF family protein [unclassified Actinoplanes]|uniref:ElyC/SanA/YdcF family protein n=1 Tax=unclassified Actinoplanes TaxID=2626549 RepID=UPI0002F0AE6C|nr:MULTISPECIES: ElyC/SanA/YdcF family protein [unclassified Actinoplanes]
MPSPRDVAHLTTLADFCAVRDVGVLSREALGPVDVAILFGGSILAGGDLFARAITDRVADHFMIVGGEGHSSDVLRAAMRSHLGGDDVPALSEAGLFDRYLRRRYGVHADLLEHESTNCGSNVRNALALLAARGVPHRRILLVQDASMQRRMDAGFRRHAPGAQIVNFAAHRTTVDLIDGEFGFRSPPAGMWPVDRYVALLMGEIPRFAEYGPAGRGFIAHVDVPDEVTRAFAALREAGVAAPRVADQRWA